MPELLLELFSEEIPARMQQRAAADLKRLVCDRLKDAQLSFDNAEVFATPRRLTLVVDGLPAAQPDITVERKGPRVGAPDKAIAGFLKGAGLTSLDQVEIRDTGKGEAYFAVEHRKGRPTAEVLAEALPGALGALPWPKSMRWGAGATRWVRPLHRILCLFDGSVVPFEFGPVTAGNATSGHRFLAPDAFEVRDFADYRDKLREAYVMLDPAERRKVIEDDARRAAEAEGLTLTPDPALVAENAGLVEWPVVLMGSIDPAYMDLPPEVLRTSMRSHQKYFSLTDAKGNLAPRFCVVANMQASDGGTQIVAGNERVLRARLADAKFFWDKDRERTLESRVPDLDAVVYHAKLGSLGDKVKRVAALAAEIAKHVPGADPKRAHRAATLAKADLTTGMVGEFPDLQGVMGRYYALADGEDASVAEAAAEHYSPQGPADDCPSAPESVCVALADKIDTLVGFWAIDEKPTGSRDPFALRRAALGVIRLIVENGLRAPLTPTFAFGLLRYSLPASEPSMLDNLLDFFADRLKVHLREKGVRHDLISAVFALGGEDDLVRLLARVDALQTFLASDDGEHLLVAYRRAANIVRIEQKKDKAVYDGAEVNAELLREADETAVAETLSAVVARADGALADEKFGEAMAALAALRAPVDAFFDNVTVNCDEPDLRVNRLRLLAGIRAAMDRVADFSKIEGGTP